MTKNGPRGSTITEGIPPHQGARWLLYSHRGRGESQVEGPHIDTVCELRVRRIEQLKTSIDQEVAMAVRRNSPTHAIGGIDERDVSTGGDQALCGT